MPALTSGLALAAQAKRMTAAINGALDATKRQPQYRVQRFLEALHANGFDVCEVPDEETPLTSRRDESGSVRSLGGSGI